MSARNLHRMGGAVFVHAYPGQCDRCVFRLAPDASSSWPFCAYKCKLLCCEKKRRSGCPAFHARVEPEVTP